MIPQSLYPKFFAQLRKASLALGYTDKDAQHAYYERVLTECGNCTSIRRLASQTAYDACLARFAADSGEFRHAVAQEVEQSRRLAYVIKVMALQVCQLELINPSLSRNYFERILYRAFPSTGHHADGESFHLDLPRTHLQTVLQILDTHRRRLLRRQLPGHPIRFNDREEYRLNAQTGNLDPLPVGKFHYANHPFSVVAS